MAMTPVTKFCGLWPTQVKPTAARGISLQELVGEEFVALLPDTDLEEAHAIAEKQRIAFARQDFIYAWRGTPIPFTGKLCRLKYGARCSK
jgi:hypothetical protein